MKVNKEEMLGMMVAVERFLASSITPASKRASSTRRAERDPRPPRRPCTGVTAEIFVPEVANHVPHVRVVAGTASPGCTASGGRHAPCATASRRSAIRPERRAVVIGVWMMRPGEDRIVARRLRQVLLPPKRRARSRRGETRQKHVLTPALRLRDVYRNVTTQGGTMRTPRLWLSIGLFVLAIGLLTPIPALAQTGAASLTGIVTRSQRRCRARRDRHRHQPGHERRLHRRSPTTPATTPSRRCPSAPTS